ncbi:heterokaryon incompatibility protein-domain-containing protein [Cercophora scortea]|uniref:Heterokaryon incompatibility protein-domain-containing protein n=1 Tax=Cercophora scortea TaxID=314031 RepID=A0AAE0M6X3_9PEZI|nr:heterokaryon incompatibility protein-domain-containing protein [Cercophora scortea]
MMKPESCNFCQTRQRQPKTTNPLLCHRCQHWDDFNHVLSCESIQYARIDLDIFGADNNPSPGNPATRAAAGYDQTLSDLPFLPLNHYREASQCTICALVTHMIGDHLLDSQDAHVSLSLWRPFTVQRPEIDNLEEGIAVPIKCILPVCIKTVCDNISRPETYKRLVFELDVSYHSPLGRGFRNMQPWDRGQYDHNTVKRWLELCCAEHGDDSNEESPQIQLPPGFRVVDTVSNCVVHLQDIIIPTATTTTITTAAAFKFAALSYQWRTATVFPTRDLALQTANAVRLGAPNSLDPSQLPEVIADAMRVCQDLGIRHLWVDRLCIVQDDAALRQPQIQGMAAIYQLAHVTIVALAEGVGTGLPGVPGRPRGNHGLPVLTSSHSSPRCWDLDVDDLCCSAPALFKLLVTTSGWNTRGWTFQEKVLSKRRLFFGANHVYLSCNRIEGCLDTILAKHLAPQTYPGHYIVPGPHTSSISRGLQRASAYPFGIYAEAAEDYAARRSLSHQHDILDAFAGVSCIVGLTANTTIPFGIPENYLSQGLLWGLGGSRACLTKELGLPAWSWAAWKHAPCSWTWKPATDGWNVLYVMIAARRKGGVYSRLSVGVVDPQLWTDIKPRWQPVILI